MGEKYLIDTNVVIEFFGGRLSAAAHAFLASVNTSLSVITQIELFSKRVISDEELKFLNDYIIMSEIYSDINKDIVANSITIRKEYKIKLPDAIIAATALAHDMTLISRNSKDFIKIKGLKFIDSSNIQNTIK